MQKNRNIKDHPKLQQYRNELYDEYDRKLESDEENSNPLIIITDSKTHTDIHSDKTDTEILNRILNENETLANSSFENQKSMYDYIFESIYNEMNNILYWLDDVNIGEQQDFHTYFKGECTGHGFLLKNQTIREYETSHVAVILEKCYKTKGNKFGFTLITAYPDITEKTAKPTNRDLTPVIQQTDKYKQASSIQKAYYEYIANPKHTQPIAFHGTSDKSQDMIELRLTKQHQLHRIRIRDISITYDILNDPKSRPLKSFRTNVLPMLQKYCPELYDTARRLTNRIDKLNTPSDRGKRAEQKFQDIIDKLSPECQDEPDIT